MVQVYMSICHEGKVYGVTGPGLSYIYTIDYRDTIDDPIINFDVSLIPDFDLGMWKSILGISV